MKLLTYLQQKLGFARRKIINFLKHGCIFYNGEVCTDGLRELQNNDEIILQFPNKKPFKVKYASEDYSHQHQYVLLFNKPKGYVVSFSDPHNRIIYDLLPSKYRTGWYYIGRLDKDSRGLVILTSDPKLVDKYAHPSHEIPKTYLVQIDKSLQKQDMEQMKKGLWVDEWGNEVVIKQLRKHHVKKNGSILLQNKQYNFQKEGLIPKEIDFQHSINSGSVGHGSVDFLRVTSVFYIYKKSQHRLKIVLHAGKKRHIRRLLRALGYKVLDLIRISIGPYTLGNIKPGKFRCVRKIKEN